MVGDANSTAWDYLRKELADDFRLIVWDLPGLARSTRSDIAEIAAVIRGSQDGPSKLADANTERLTSSHI